MNQKRPGLNFKPGLSCMFRSENYFPGIFISRPAPRTEFGSKPLYFATSVGSAPIRVANFATVSPAWAFTIRAEIPGAEVFSVVGREYAIVLILLPLTGTKTLPLGSFIPGFAAISSATPTPVRFEIVCQDSPCTEFARFVLLILEAGMRRKTATTSLALPGGTLIT